MLVSELMTRDLVSVDREATLGAAAEAMVAASVGSAIVTSDGTPAGIVTETDALAAGATAEVPFDEISVADAASAPLVTIQPDATVRTAVQRMTDEGIKKLPVLEGMELLGILTRSDVVLHYHDIVREAHDEEEQRDVWESNRLTSGDVSELIRLNE